MAIPKEPLELKFDPDELTVGEYEDLSVYSMTTFRVFVETYGNWTRAQIRALTRKEWLGLRASFYDQITEALVPKETPPDSTDGPAA